MDYSSANHDPPRSNGGTKHWGISIIDYRKIPLALFVVLTLGGTGHLCASPRDGWAVFGGLAYNTSTGKYTEGANAGQTFGTGSAGLSVAGDYQFVLDAKMSIVAFLAGSSESASSGELRIDTARHSVIGAQFRYWMDELYAGAHIGTYTEVLVDSDTNNSAGASGFGAGVTLGYETGNGYIVSGQIDQASLNSVDAALTLFAIRLHIGYRWRGG